MKDIWTKLGINAVLSLFVVGVFCDDIIYIGQSKVEEGKPFTIKCILTHFETPKWNKDGIYINPNNKEYEFTSYPEINGESFRKHHEIYFKLHVKKARSYHTGNYRCYSFSSTFHRLEVISKPTSKGKDIFDEVILTENKAVTLICNIAEDVVFPVNWYREGQKILVERDPRITVEDRTLTINPAQESDAGNYSCDTVSQFSHPIQGRGRVIYLKSRARIESLPHQLSIQAGKDLTVECKVHGYPKPWITWYIGNDTAYDKPVADDRIEIHPNSDGYPNAILIWRNISYGDREIIRCEAENTVNVASSSSLLVVRPNIIITNEDEQGKGVIMELEKMITLQCNVSSPVPFELIWYKDSALINPSSRIIVIPENNSLVIYNTTIKDAGQYTCAIDGFTNFTIDVYVKTQMVPFERSMNLVQGDTLTLHCQTIGAPLPILTWYKDEKLIDETEERIEFKIDDTQVPNAKLIIKNVDYVDRAKYTCFAENGVGEVSNSTILVRVKDKLAALWPFLGICCEIFLLFIIIFIYEKRRSHSGDDDSDTDIFSQTDIPIEEKESTSQLRQRR
ncbi:neuroplastin-like isoform X1 [Centruroides vittatus]|uniref:neuroplastin-like isoform X1 n=1 Tax=Centruroides vittatus TaxID=120091 RepID=UPI00351043BF